MDSEFSRKKALVFGSLFFVVLAIPMTVYTALQKQDTRIQAAAEVPENTVIMAINGEQITKAQIRAVAQEQNDPNAVDRQALLDAQETLKERKILDLAAKNYKLTPDQERIDRFKQEEFSDTESKYEALKQQIILKAVNSVEALSIGFWNPPASELNNLNETEKENASNQLSQGVTALALIESGMKSGVDTLVIADSVLIDNPDLAPVLAVNGYIVAPLTGVDRALATYPLIYEWGDSSLDTETKNAVFALSRDGVGKTLNTQANRGGSVFRIINKGNSDGSSTYNAWLIEQKASLVRSISPL